VIFRYFAVPEEYQHRVLFWGILGALLMRGSFILAGSGSSNASVDFYGLGALLVYSGIRLAFAGEHKVDPSRNPIVKAIRRFMPVTDTTRQVAFLCVLAGKSGALCYPAANSPRGNRDHGSAFLPSIPSPPSWPSPQRSSSTPRMFLPYSACARCSSLFLD